MFKYPIVGLDTIVLSYGQPKDAAALIKSNEALSRYVGVNFKAGVPKDTRAILSVTDSDLKLPEYPDDIAGKFDFLKWETEINAISKKIKNGKIIVRILLISISSIVH